MPGALCVASSSRRTDSWPTKPPVSARRSMGVLWDTTNGPPTVLRRTSPSTSKTPACTNPSPTPSHVAPVSSRT
jgi:hypothetical protein